MAEKGKLIGANVFGWRSHAEGYVAQKRRAYPEASIRIHRRRVKADGVKLDAWVVVIRERVAKAEAA